MNDVRSNVMNILIQPNDVFQIIGGRVAGYSEYFYP